MSKIAMKRILISGMRSDRKRILEALQRAGVVEVTSEEIDDEELMHKDVSKEQAQFGHAVQKLEQALELLNHYAPKEGGLFASLEGPADITLDEYERRQKDANNSLVKATEILNLGKKIGDLRGSIPKIESKITALLPWMELDIPLNTEETGETAVFIGSVKNDVPLTELAEKISAGFPGEREIPYDLHIISHAKEITCFYAVCLKRDREETEAALRSAGFMRAPQTALVPKEEAAAMQEEIRTTESEIRKLIEKVKSYAYSRDDMEFASDYFQMRADKYEVLNRLPQSANAFFVYGYVPENYAEPLKEKLEKNFRNIIVEEAEPEPTDNVPVLLRNGFFADPMESVVESYSLPNKSEIDPSKVLSWFYYIFFGLMLSDAGYGLLLVLGCGIALLKVKNMKKSMKQLLKLFFFSGISTVFWGFMFGSFFGDAVNVIATQFFNRPDIALKPIWFEPLTEPMRMLVFAFGLGIVHLFTGLFLKFYLCIKNKDYAGAICDVLFWFLFVGGGILYLLTMPMVTKMLNLDLGLSPLVAKIAAVVAIIGCAGVVLFGGRESKSVPKRLMKGAYAAYGVTGWLSDILSYSRLLALGLATGVIAQVFNKMGSMLGSAWYGILIFIIVFLIGHVLNLAINVLGAYVHTNRLQFVEFFGKFYEGGGREYKPFKENTKYYNVKEDK